MATLAMSEKAVEKRALRGEIRRRLSAMTGAERHTLSARACERIAQADFFNSALTVMLYLPLDEELDVTPLALRCFQLGKTVCAPRIDWDHRRMTPIEVRSFDDKFEVQRHGVREPRGGRCIGLEEIDLIVVPGLAFDAAGARLGRGGGFFDRFLAQAGLRGHASRCGVAFECQIVDSIPEAATDLRMHALATERRLVRVESPKAGLGRPAER